MPGTSPITKARAGDLPIGELSRRTGVNIETIRYYEKIGLLPAPPRTPGGRRVYGADHLRMLGFVRRGRELGFSLDAIRSLIALGSPGAADCVDVCAIAGRHLDDVRRKIADLRALEHMLSDAMQDCRDSDERRCAVLDALTGKRRETAAA